MSFCETDKLMLELKLQEIDKWQFRLEEIAHNEPLDIHEYQELRYCRQERIAIENKLKAIKEGT